MKKYVLQTLDFLLFSNLFMALCTVAQGLVTYHLLNTKPDKYVLGLLFCSTLGLYNFSVLLSKPASPKESTFKRVVWFFEHYRLMISITIIVVLSIIPLFLFLSAESQILLAFLGVLSVGYSLPLFTVNDKKFGLRNIPGAKLFLIAVVWSLSTVLLPILEVESHKTVAFEAKDIILLIAKRFLFIAAIAVPFDIRDLFQDRTYELKTIPVMLGEKKAYLFCQFLLAAYLVLLFLFTSDFNRDFFGLFFTIVLAGWLIFKSNWKKNEYYYFFYLDGILILQYVFLIAFSLI